MKKVITSISLLLTCLSITYSPISFAKEDPVLVHGKKLHTEKCNQCHNDSVYKREDRQVKTLRALSNQVNNCMKGAAKAQWTISETNSVVEFLNTTYYKF